MESVELNDKYIKLRIAAAVIFLVIGAAAIAYGVGQIFAVPKGWQEIEAGSSTTGITQDLTLLYDLGAGSESARAEKRALTSIYSQAADDACMIFDGENTYGRQGSLAALNLHPNEEVELEPALWSALKLLEESGDRTMYLGPAFGIYDNVFYCDDWQLEEFDPERSETLRVLFARIAAYASDPDSVRVELTGENRARLVVSEEYLRFLADQELDGPLDLYWMRGAFIVDYVAQALLDAGYTHGSISSADGFARNLDSGRDVSYSMMIYDLRDGLVYEAARVDYTGAMSMAVYRSYPLTGADSRRYRVAEDGGRNNRYLSLTDATPHTAVDTLAAYSKTLSCAELMVLTSPAFTDGPLTALADGPFEAVWPEDGTIYATDAAGIVCGEGYELETLQ